MVRNPLNRPIFFKLGIWLASRVPVRLAYGLTHRVAEVQYVLMPAARKAVQRNLSRVVPGDPERVRRLSLQLFRNYGETLADFVRFNGYFYRHSVEEVITAVEGRHHLEEALARGKGLLLLTAHLGNWELGGIFFGCLGHPISILTHEDELAGNQALKERYRSQYRIRTIVVGNTPLASVEVLNALGRGEIVAMLIDRYSPRGGIPVDFFGKPAYFPVGPVILSQMTGAPLLPAFVVRETAGNYRGIVTAPILPERTGDREKDVRQTLTRIVRVFEEVIRRYPDQWYNFVPIWPED